ncbi:MAG: hypothetical protein LBD58_05820 [Treponema sp.]|jgi:hypothetical protein|nr:hypothetical protein [Treponema sp.]
MRLLMEAALLETYVSLKAALLYERILSIAQFAACCKAGCTTWRRIHAALKGERSPFIFFPLKNYTRGLPSGFGACGSGVFGSEPNTP